MINTALSKIKFLSITLLLFAISTSAQDADKNVNQKIYGKNRVPNFITFNENSTYRSNNSRQLFTEQLGLKQNQVYSWRCFQCD